MMLFRDVPVDVCDKVAALKKQGRSLPETVAAKPSARYDEVWGPPVQSRSDLVVLVYEVFRPLSGARCFASSVLADECTRLRKSPDRIDGGRIARPSRSGVI